MTMASVEKGRLMVKALQLGMAMKRLVAIANGTTGRPDSEASVAMPSPARRAGPGGTSAVIATVAPLVSARSDSRNAVAPPRLRFRLPAPAPLIRLMPKRSSTAPIAAASPWRETMARTSAGRFGFSFGSSTNCPCHMARICGCWANSLASISSGSRLMRLVA